MHRDESPDQLADLIPDAPRPSLRERKKASAMRRLQQVAMEQFEEHGFDNVSVEHIAEHAEVSPSSVYRYFGTKEGLVVRDEVDAQILAVAPVLLRRYGVFDAFEVALRYVAGMHLVDDLTRRRIKVWLETPSVRAAGFLAADEITRSLAGLWAAEDGAPSPAECRVVCSCLVFTVIATVEEWYLGGCEQDVAALTIQRLRLIRPAWAGPPGVAADGLPGA